MTRPSTRGTRSGPLAAGLSALALLTAACAAPDSTAARAEERSFAEIQDEAQ